MTCFWDGILHNLNDDDFQRVFQVNKPNNKNLIKLLKDNNRKTKNINWNGEIFSEKQLEENFIHIKDFNEKFIGNGYLCSTCDPFLVLICELFTVNINHNYCGYLMTYTNSKSIKTLNFKSNKSHFSAIK
jgi:hypothetical protein|tara:strand:+ start:1060 stop:1449 length:390 start_codon:yes stop_codon:yes gene_type:complete